MAHLAHLIISFSGKITGMGQNLQAPFLTARAKFPPLSALDFFT
jgi:hypothetical protein